MSLVRGTLARRRDGMQRNRTAALSEAIEAQDDARVEQCKTSRDR